MNRALPFLIFSILIAGSALSGDLTPRRAALRKLVERAAARDPKALYDLAFLHDTGYDSIPVDSARSTALYRLSAELGYPKAQNYLGFRYFKGEFVKKDPDSAMFWISRAAAAGDPSAASNLGYIFTDPHASPEQREKGVLWLEKAAEAGVPQGESLLADLYRTGDGVKKDTAEATELYTRAIEGGLHDAELKLLSMMGKKWESLTPDSAVCLGRYYYTRRAPVIATTLFRNAALYGNPDALALLGDAYSKGYGVSYDHDLSTRYFLQAANGGNPAAQFIIAELLDFFPDALPDSVAPAQYWYEKAAESGITDAEEATRRLLYGSSR